MEHRTKHILILIAFSLQSNSPLRAITSAVDVEEKIWNHRQQPNTVYIGVHGWFEGSVHVTAGGR
jgi:hypothetical protein